MRTRILLLILVYLLLLNLILSAEKEEKKDYTNLPWQKLFTEPSETAYVIMKDKQVFRFSSANEIRVSFTVVEIEKELKKVKKTYDLKDIEIIIHNHRRRQNFCPRDRLIYRNLKRRGFKGSFLLYCHRTNETYDIEDEIKSK